MRKLSLLIALAFAVLLVASACGGGEEPAGTPEPTATATPAETPGAPAAGRISFESDRVDDGVTEIYTVNRDGSDLTQLTTTGATGHAWSPDGSRVAFDSGEPFLESAHDIYVMNADGSDLTRLTDDPGHDFLPKWSPDGKKIAFLSIRDGNLEIYIMNTDGSGQARLTDDPADDTYGFLLGLQPLFSANPWSPDGERIAFNRGSFGPPDDEGTGEVTFAVYVMNSDGSSQTRFTEQRTVRGIVPWLLSGWSPDGNKLLLYSGSVEGAQIYVVNADGTGLTRLMDLPNQNPQGFPIWSPDGSRIAFTADRDGRDAIHIMNADGTDVAPLTTGVDAASGADSGFERCDGLFGTAWSPDSKRIVFGRGCDFERAELWVVSADGSGETQVVDSPAFSPTWVPAP